VPQTVCEFCEPPDTPGDPTNDVSLRGGKYVLCSCGDAHDLCVFCYEYLKVRKLIVKHWIFKVGYMERLIACPKNVRVADKITR